MDSQNYFSSNVFVDVCAKNDPIGKEFYKCIETGNLSRVKEMIREYPNIITNTNFLGRSPLNYAITHNQLAVFDELFQNNGIKLDDSFLRIAIVNNNVEFFDYMIGNGFPITDDCICTSLSMGGNFEFTKMLIQHYPQFDFNYYSDKCAPPLVCYLSAMNPKLEVVKFFIDNGAQVFLPTPPNRHTTLSMMATRVVPREIFDFVFDIILMQFPQLIHLVNWSRQNSLVHVIDSLTDANFLDGIHIIRQLIENKIDVNIVFGNNSTPLSAAIKCQLSNLEKKELVELLIENDAQVTFEAMANVFIYSAYNNDEIIQILLRNGGDIDMQNQDGETILMKVIDHFSVWITGNINFDFFKNSNLYLTTKNNETAYDVMMKALRKYPLDEVPETVFDGIKLIGKKQKYWRC